MPHARVRELEVDGTSVRYYDDGSDRRPVLLVHGTGGTMEGHFGRVIPMLAAKNRVVGLDFGAPLGRAMELYDIVGQLMAVVEDAGISGRELAVVGYSLGAVASAAFAAEAPDLVGTLVLINGWMRTDNYQRERNAIWRALYEAQSDQLAGFSVFTAYGARYLAARTAGELDLLRAAVVATPARAAHMELNARVDISDQVSRIACPTLIISGSEDIMVPPAHGYDLLGAVEDARLAIVASGHAALAERPAQVYSLIDRFVSEAMTTPPGGLFLQPAI